MIEKELMKIFERPPIIREESQEGGEAGQGAAEKPRSRSELLAEKMANQVSTKAKPK